MATQNFALACYETTPATGLSFLDITAAACTTGACSTAFTESYECNQKFVPSGTAWNTGYTLKIPHYLSADQLFATLGVDPADPSTFINLFNDGAEHAAEMCETSCNDMIPAWTALMNDCQAGYTGLDFAADVSAAIAEMLAICKCGCDYDHPNGASEIPLTFTSPYDAIDPWLYATPACSTITFTSFTQVFDNYFPDRDVVNCPDMGITYPQSYTDANINTPTPVVQLDTCGCNKLFSAQEEYNDMVAANGGIPPFQLQSLKDFIRIKYSIDLENIEQIKCFCEENWEGITPWEADMPWPGTAVADLSAFTGYVPAVLSCGPTICKDCAELSGVMFDFFDAYLGVAQTSDDLVEQLADAYAGDPDFETSLTNYFHQLSPFYLGYNASELVSFYYHCLYNNAVSFTRPSKVDSGCLVEDNALYATLLLTPVTDAINSLINTTTAINSYNNSITTGSHPDYFGLPPTISASPAGYSKYLVNSAYSTITQAGEPRKIVVVTYNSDTGSTSGVKRIFNILLPDDVNPITGNLELELVNAHPLTPASAYASSYEISSFAADLVLHYSGGDVTLLNVVVERMGFYQVADCKEDDGAFREQVASASAKLCNTQPNLTAVTPANCFDTQINELHSQGTEAWIAYLDDAQAEFITRYKSTCLKGIDETMKLTLEEKAFAITLYYYDQAGNLVMTVPPEGVNKKSTGNDHERHLLVTEYKYDSENKLMSSANPDHLNLFTDYYYSDKSRLMASANPKQKITDNDNFSYSAFDRHERLTEAGESDGLVTIKAAVFDYSYLPSDGYEHVLRKLIALQSQRDISHTWYDVYPTGVSSALLHPATFYLRNRVSASAFFNSASSTWTTATSLRAFTYDAHGMVPEQVNIMPELFNESWSRPTSFFRTEYSYNVFSGLMDTVTYQRGRRDQFIHHYSFDSDLRISFVHTSKDNVVWDQDARYIYYPHGPLARTELGHDKIQGVDYAYTLQGWLKMINGTRLSELFDMGQDGSYGTVYSTTADLHQQVAYDAYGFSLNYFNHGVAGGGDIAKDYSPVLPRADNPLLDESTFPFIFTADAHEVGQDLYNGNISGSTTTFIDINPGSSTFGNLIPMASFYRYDQLNRLKKSQSFDLTISRGLDWDAYYQDDRYQMQLTYDMNGNILTLQRNGNDAGMLDMDMFNYNYYSLNTSSSPVHMQLTSIDGDNTSIATNRLSLLEENTSFAGNYSTDIDGDVSTGEVTYEYDALGNLTQDLSEEIEEIKWNAYGKVVEVIRTATCMDKPDLVYEYDAFGQRTKKVVKSRTGGVLDHEKNWQTTWYSRDAQGNVMAVYDHYSFYNDGDNSAHENIKLHEWDLYGSGRLGTRTPEKILLAWRNYEWISSTVTSEAILPLPDLDDIHYRHLGEKTFELTNHLGNVIATVSDRKLMHEDDMNPGYIHHYTAEVLSIGEQYAFGMSMPGRTYSVEKYKYGFNGKENDDEAKGDANQQDYGMRIYDNRTSRFFSMDPIGSAYPELTTYQFASNTPIWAIDFDGLQAIVKDVTYPDGTKITLTTSYEHPKEFELQTNGGTSTKFNLSFKPSNRSLRIFKGNSSVTVKEDNPDVMDLLKTLKTIYNGKPVVDIILDVLAENPDFELLIIGNHGITRGEISSDANGNYPFKEFNSLRQNTFNSERASNTRKFFFKNSDLITPKPVDNELYKKYTNFGVKPKGVDPIGIQILFNVIPKSENKDSSPEQRCPCTCPAWM